MLVAQGQWERLGTRSLVFVPVKVRKNSQTGGKGCSSLARLVTSG